VERIVFDIYTPGEKKLRITPNRVVLIMWLILIVVCWAGERYVPYLVRDIALFIALCVTIFFIFRSFVTYPPLSGQLKGKIEFTNDAIIINDTHFNITSIYKIDFHFGDYYGEVRYGYRSVNPRLSQGVNNRVEFTTNNDEQHIIQFKIRTKQGYLVLSSFINSALNSQKISRYRATELIGEESIIIPQN